MLTQLRAIFDLIVQFQNTQESMYHTALDELRARQRLDELAKQRTKQVSKQTEHYCAIEANCPNREIDAYANVA